MLIRYRDGKFITYTVEDGLPHAIASRIEEDERGNLWINWYSSDVHPTATKFDGERFVNYKQRDFAHSVGVNFGGGRYPWYSQDSARLHCFVKGQVRTYLKQRDIPKAEIIGISPDAYGNLWIQTNGAGVIKVTDGQRKLFTTREGLPNNNEHGYFLEDRKGNLWLASHRDGRLYRIRDGKHELARTSEVFALYEDREGSIWLGTSEGLHRWRELTVTLTNQRDGLSANSIYSIFQDLAGAIWVGTWAVDGGVNKYEDGRFTHYRKAEGLPSDLITCIYQDNSGRLWVGTSHGVSYFNNGRFKSYAEESGFLKRHVWAMRQDRAGNLWFGTDGGLVKLKDGHFTEYTSKDGLSHDRITALFEDRAGALWIGAFQGLTRLKDGVFTAYAAAHGFTGNQVRAIYEDGDSVLWIGTYDGGLYRLKDERLTRYTRKEGLHDNVVFQILEDDAGNLWMGCNRGIYRVSRRGLNDFAEGRARSITSVVFGIKDGLASLECNGGRQPSGLKTADGRLWFPTMGGVAIVDPKAIPNNTMPPPVIIEEFYLDDEPIDFEGGVKIPPDKNSFEIRFTAPSFIKPEQVKLRYKLEGRDGDWIDAGDRRTARYHRIPDGRYRFLVIAADNDGVWSAEGKSIEITVIPPFWRRWWFVALVTFAITSIIILRYKQRVRHLRREHAIQQAFSRQLIDSQESERKRIASELHDSLEQYLLVVKNNASLGINMAEDGSPVKEKLEEVSSTTSQALEEVRKIAHNLRPSHLDELGLKDALEAMVDSVASSSKIRFSAEIDSIVGILSKEAEMNLYRIAQECISNILKHSGATEAKVAFKRDGRRARLVIRDNGKGFNADPSVPVRSTPQNFGLTGISERARMLGGKEVIHSVPGQGTTITVTLTLQDERHEE
jgi:signal transduction histidine kinase/ligand-binding sensor domain-containing protein